MASKRAKPADPTKSPSSDTGLRVLVLSGPNLDRLGRREPHIYGRTTLAEIHAAVTERAAARGAGVDCRQTNHEGALIDWIGAAKESGFDGILLNAGAFTHTSYALHDAVKGCEVPTIEVHISNPEAREPFRHVSRIAPACRAKVAGFGPASYTVALEGLLGIITAGAARARDKRAHGPRPARRGPSNGSGASARRAAPKKA
jgi:3-dehydroquinate dehydratase-2